MRTLKLTKEEIELIQSSLRYSSEAGMTLLKENKDKPWSVRMPILKISHDMFMLSNEIQRKEKDL